jgi:hypothetical protein
VDVPTPKFQLQLVAPVVVLANVTQSGVQPESGFCTNATTGKGFTVTVTVVVATGVPQLSETVTV